ncbi:hypothetical protein EDC04DRAFT_2953046 [Pisolithus marmoratus]|nr:hypothetical protein EDC04DRAFT_2953046 [Pisolithus marmoratus]
MSPATPPDTAVVSSTSSYAGMPPQETKQKATKHWELRLVVPSSPHEVPTIASPMQPGTVSLALSWRGVPSANQLATLLYVTSTLEPNYDIKETQCYWFAATVFGALKSLFGGVEQEIANCRAGTTRGVRITSIKDSMEPVCERYKAARATLAEEIEQKRKAEQQVQEEERRQERAQREAAQEAAKGNWEQRQRAEEEQQREHEHARQ